MAPKLYVFFSILEPFFGAIVAKLSRDGAIDASVCGCVWGRQSLDALKAAGIGETQLLVLSDVFRSRPQAVDVEFIRRYEDSHGGLTAPMIVAADRVADSFPYADGISHLEAALRAVEGAFDRWHPDVLFLDDVSCIPSYAHYLVARRRNIPTLILGPSRLPGRAMIYSNPLALFDRAEKQYQQIKADGLSSQEREAARAYADGLISNTAPPPFMAYMGQRPAARSVDLSVLWSLWRYRNIDKGNYTLISPAAAVRRRVTRIVHAWLQQTWWEGPVKDEKYVLFPLHYQPEASTSVRAPFFLDQCALAENIARAIPVGYRLYVKEHAAGLGRRPISDVKRLRRIPSVRLIDPKADSRELLAAASCVATITGTMGWEAILRGIPVVVFGRVFYESCPGAFRAAAPHDYPKVFSDALQSQADPKGVEDFVAALLRASFPGRTGHPFYLPDILEPANISSIARHLSLELSSETAIR